MTTAAGIEIGTGATVAQGMGKAQGAGYGVLAAGSAASTLSSLKASQGQDFRSGWQSLLTELGQVSGTAAGLVSGTNSSATATGVKTASTSQTNSAQTAGAALLREQGLEVAKGEAGKKSLTSTEAELPASTNRLGAASAQAELKSKSESSKTEEKKPASKSVNESSAILTGANYNPPVQSAGIAVEALPGAPAITNASSSQIDLAPAVTNQASIVQAKPTATAMAGSASEDAGKGPDSAMRQGTKQESLAAKQDQPQAASGLVASIQGESSEETSLAAGLPALSTASSSRSEVEITDAGQRDLQTSAVDLNQTSLSSPELNAAIAIPSSRSAAATAQTGQNLSSHFGSELNGGQSISESTAAVVEPRQSPALAVDSAQGTSQNAALIPKQAQSFATTQDQSENPALSLNPAPAVVLNPKPASTVQSIQETTPELASSQIAVQGVETNQSGLPAAITSSIAVQSTAVHQNQELPPASRSHSVQSDLSYLPKDQAVEVSQSKAPVGTESSGTISVEAKSSAPVSLPAHSGSTTEQTAIQAAARLNSSQPLAVAPDPVQTVAPGKDTSPTTASRQSINAALSEPLQLEAQPALVGTGVLNPTVAANFVASVDGTSSTHLPNADKLVASGSGKTAVSGVARTERKASGSNAVQSGGLIASGGSTGLVADASSTVRELAGVQGAGTAAHGVVSKSAAAVEFDAAKTFEALDAQGAPGRASWIHTGAQQAEAGFQDPELGWVGVRADASGGGIHAQLVASSADAAQALSGHMAGLNTFLAEHHTPVETLTLSTNSGSGMGFAGESGSGGGMQQGTGEQPGQQATQSAGLDSASNLTSSRAQLSETALSKPVWPTGSNDNGQRTQWVGGHISVMA